MGKPSPFVRNTNQPRIHAKKSSLSQFQAQMQHGSQWQHMENSSYAESCVDRDVPTGVILVVRASCWYSGQGQLWHSRQRVTQSAMKGFRAKFEKDTVTYWKEIEPQNIPVKLGWTHTLYAPNNVLLSAINPNGTLEICLGDQNI